MKIPLDADFPVEKQPRPNAALLQSKLVTKAPANATDVQQKPVVTVVTAIFNVIKNGRKEQFLQCMDSVQAQTGTAIEHLIIDGASTDGTIELIQNYQNPNVPIRLLSEPDSGIYDAMNKGLWLARGQYVIFLNSDDFYTDPNGLADSVRRLEGSGADFSYAPIQVLNETDGTPVGHIFNYPNANIIFLEMPFSHQSVMLRREAMLEINGFDLRYHSGADYDSILRLIFTGHRACLVSTSFVAFRLGGFSFANQEQSQQEVGMIFSRLYKQYLGMEITPDEGTQIYLTKQCPKTVRQRQFHFAKAAFGNAIQYMYSQPGDDLCDDLVQLTGRIHALSWQRGFFAVMRTVAGLLLLEPVRFLKFLRFYVQLRKNHSVQDAKRIACDRLLAQIQFNCSKKIDPKNNDQLFELSRPYLRVVPGDYWCTDGIYIPESWGAWTDKKFSAIIRLPKNCLKQELTADINLGAFIFPKSPRRIVDVFVNGEKVDQMIVENFMPQMHHFKIPAKTTTSDILDIVFEADQAFIPHEIGTGEDKRVLGMTFQKLSIKQPKTLKCAKRRVGNSDELKIGFLNRFTQYWIGGITYFKNLFMAMETTESPHLKPYIMPPADDSGDCLLSYATIFPNEEYPQDPDNPPTAQDFHMDMLSHLSGDQVLDGGDGIAWVADFQHLHLPEMFGEEEIAHRNQSYHELAERNRIVCLSSHDAMEDFKNFAPGSADKARCLHFVSIPEPGIYQFSEEEAAEIRRKYQLPERYFYVPNQFWKHKNHQIVFKAVAELKKAGFPVHVVFSGKTFDFRFPDYFEELKQLYMQEGIEENLHFLGLIPLKDVYFLMRNTLAIINPSKFEGWSSSVEEAKSIGKTIFLSNLNVHYEQMPPHGTYFPCDDPLWLADLMRRAWNELSPGPDLEMEKIARKELPRRIKQFGKDFQRIVLDAINGTNSEATQAQSEPCVSVVTVVRAGSNQNALIDNLESVAEQKDIQVEHLLVDQNKKGSSSLAKLAEKYGCRVILEPDHGIFGAMNRGAIQSRGKYVTFLPAENHYEADNFLKQSVEALEKENFDFSFVAGQGNGLLPIPVRLPPMLFARKALYSVAVCNDTLCSTADYDLLLRLILAGKRGIQVDGAGVSSGNVIEQNAGEYAQVHARLGAKLNISPLPTDEEELRQALQSALQPYFDRTFGANR